METLIQVWIVLFGCLAAFLITIKGKHRRMGYIAGLIGQPAWFYTTYTNEQWGVFVLAFFYTYCWARGVYNFFIKI